MRKILLLFRRLNSYNCQTSKILPNDCHPGPLRNVNSRHKLALLLEQYTLLHDCDLQYLIVSSSTAGKRTAVQVSLLAVPPLPTSADACYNCLKVNWLLISNTAIFSKVVTLMKSTLKALGLQQKVEPTIQIKKCLFILNQCKFVKASNK